VGRPKLQWMEGMVKIWGSWGSKDGGWFPGTDSHGRSERKREGGKGGT